MGQIHGEKTKTSTGMCFFSTKNTKSRQNNRIFITQIFLHHFFTPIFLH